MSIFQGLLIFLDLLLVIILFKEWSVFKAGIQRTFVSLIMGLSLIFVFPSVYSSLNKMKKVTFCLSCHEMENYGKSLKVNDTEPLAAVHWQNNFIQQSEACYSCHADYTVFGEITAKMRGLRHLYVHYLGKAPEKIKLYNPYSPFNCIYCHGTAKRFLKKEIHKDNLEELLSGKLSCLEMGCHDLGHLSPEDMLDDEEPQEEDTKEEKK
jgi:cytochrome c-type protein NapC